MKYWRSDKGEFYSCDEFSNIEESKSGFKPLPKEGYPYTIVYHNKREENLGKLLDNEIYENQKFAEFYEDVLKKLEEGKTLEFCRLEYEHSEDPIPNFPHIRGHYRPVYEKFEASESIKENYTKDSLEMEARMAKVYCNWITGPLSAYMNENAIKHIPIEVDRLRELANLIEFTDMVSFSVAAKQVLPEMIKSGERAWECIHRLNLVQTNDESEIENIVKSVVDKYPDKVKEYKNGKMNIASMFIGEVLRNSKEKKLNPKIVSESIKKYLDSI